MSLYQVALVLHVVTAVLGLGVVSGVVVIAGASSVAVDARVVLMRRLALVGSLALGTMLLTGIAIVAALHGADTETGWFRASFVLLFFAGGALGQVRGTLRKAGNEPARAIVRAGRFGAVACCFLTAIVVLMQAKPF